MEPCHQRQRTNERDEGNNQRSADKRIVDHWGRSIARRKLGIAFISSELVPSNASLEAFRAPVKSPPIKRRPVADRCDGPSMKVALIVGSERRRRITSKVQIKNCDSIRFGTTRSEM